MNDDSLVSHFRQVEDSRTFDFGLNNDEILCFRGQICVLNDVELRHSILLEAHCNPYTMHPDRNKMYRDLRELYWWPGLKRDVFAFVFHCITCQKVKARHQLASVIVDQLTKSAHFLPVRTDYSLRKLAKLYVYDILELPLELVWIHDVLHVSMLKRYQSDLSHVVHVEEIEVRQDLTFEKEPVQILDQDEKVLRRKIVPLVKVLWWNHGTKKTTWNELAGSMVTLLYFPRFCVRVPACVRGIGFTLITFTSESHQLVCDILNVTYSHYVVCRMDGYLIPFLECRVGRRWCVADRGRKSAFCIYLYLAFRPKQCVTSQREEALRLDEQLTSRQEESFRPDEAILLCHDIKRDVGNNEKDKQKAEVVDASVVKDRDNQHRNSKNQDAQRNNLDSVRCQFNDYCKWEGRERHRTVVGTPQHSGVVERMNRTLLEKARCMLSNAGLRKEFWAEAVNLASYLLGNARSNGRNVHLSGLLCRYKRFQTVVSRNQQNYC
ncbi:integrase [Gossypium australe]|uniref:Integrase n=1 Tax=Gossypium australe TaxID=47621 RepID=A0A5B6W900_9ROSI|nr:integrase [Gossypium australe]